MSQLDGKHRPAILVIIVDISEIPVKNVKFYVGTSGYGYKEWKGTFYPEKISPGEMLRFYADRFSTVEINNTFYRMPKESVLKSWSDQVPNNFVFALKAPQIITHLKRLRNVDAEAAYLFRTISSLGGKLGPVLFQFPRSFRADPSALKDFLYLLPANASCAFEFRHPSWLDGEILELLHNRGCGLCIADTDEDPAHEIISTAQWGYLRLRRSAYTDTDLSHWVKRILSQKWKKVFVFFKHEDGAGGTEMAARLRELAETKMKKSET
jgi:uncharacterized protein YecE (DUF72 family)